MIRLILILILFCINIQDNVKSEEKNKLEKLIKISVNYNAELKPNELEIKIKNLSDQDLEFTTTKKLVPFAISISSIENKVDFPYGASKDNQNPKVVRKILKNAEEIYQFDLFQVFSNKQFLYKDGTYLVEAEISYLNENKEYLSITSGETKINLKCKFEPVKEKLKIILSFPNNKVVINEKALNYKMMVRNLTEEEIALIEEFTIGLTIELVFYNEESGKTYYLGHISHWEPDDSYTPNYIKLKPKDSLDLKIISAKELLDNFDLPKGKYKVYVRYGVNMGENCFKGFLRSDEVVAEKE